VLKYGSSDSVRKVQDGGFVSFRGRDWRIGKALVGEPVGIRPTGDDDVFDVFYACQRVAQLDFTARASEL
jgi:hypothetical protein